MATSSEYLSAFEAERLVQSLVKLDLEDVGSTKWMIQHEAIERLNIQAHRNVQNNSEEYITEAFVTFDQMRTLVHDLILIQTWKQQVYPLVKKELISDDSMTAYFLNYHEATVINLLELLFFNKDAVIAVGDWIHDLNEMISQKINYLITLKHPEASDPKKLLEMTEMERFEETLFDLDFNVAISCISLFRYITDVITDLPIGIMRQVLHSMDFVVVLVHLLEAGPWIRNKKEKLERFESGKWSTIDPDELQRVGKIEGQIWLGLMNLLLEPECRKSYGYDEHNHQIVLRLKNYISEHTVDQLPPLVDLQRYLEELVMLIPAKTREPPSGIELVSEVKDNILKTSPQAASRKVRDRLLKRDSRERQAMTERLAKMYDFEDLESLLEDPKCSKCGLPAENRCSSCKSEWYCSRKCQVEAWPSHKKVCELIKNALTENMASQITEIMSQ